MLARLLAVLFCLLAGNASALDNVHRSALLNNAHNGAFFAATAALSNPNVSAGAHATLQWERTQAWTAIAFIKVAAPPALNGAAIIFTTSNEASNISASPDGTGYKGYEFWIDNVSGHVGVLHLRIISNYGGPNYLGVWGTTYVTDGKWHKVAVSYDGSSTAAGVKIYVDGKLETMSTESATLTTTIVNNQPLWIGNQRGYAYSLGGSLAEFSLSNVVRSQAWIGAYKTAKSALDSSVVLAYNFSEAGGKITSDLSSNAFTGAMNGAFWPSGPTGAAPYWVQGKLGPDLGLSSAASTAVTLTNSVAYGNAVVGAYALAGTGTVTVTDNKSNSCTVVNQNTSLASTVTGYFYCLNLTNGPQTYTATLGSGTGTYWRIVADEFANVASASAIDGHSDLYTAAASGANGASSGNFTPTANYDLIYGATDNFTGTAVTNGTGFTPLTWGTAADNEPLFSEYFFQSTAATTATTFTPASSSAMVAVGMALKSR